jgi:hypothetical protein
LLSLATNTRATSRSFLPHSSVFVARNIQAAAISCKNRVVQNAGADMTQGTRPVWDSLESNSSCKTDGTKWRQWSWRIVSCRNGLSDEVGQPLWTGTDRSKVDPRR